MFTISPDAWANAIAVIMVCITIATVFAEKVEEKRETERVSVPWAVSQLGTSTIAAFIAWEIHPHLTWMPVLVTQPVFTVLAIHGGVEFIRAIQKRSVPS